MNRLTSSIKYRTANENAPGSPISALSEYLTVKEVALILRCSPATVRRLAETGRLTGFKVGNRFRFKRNYILSLGGNAPCAGSRN